MIKFRVPDLYYRDGNLLFNIIENTTLRHVSCTYYVRACAFGFWENITFEPDFNFLHVRIFCFKTIIVLHCRLATGPYYRKISEDPRQTPGAPPPGGGRTHTARNKTVSENEKYRLIVQEPANVDGRITFACDATDVDQIARRVFHFIRLQRRRGRRFICNSNN